MRQDEGHDRNDDQHARGVDQRERAAVRPRLGAEYHHVLQPARHRGIVGGDPVEAADPVKERHPDKADDGNIDRNEGDREKHLRQPVDELRRHRRADGDAEHRAGGHGHDAGTLELRSGERREEAGHHRAEQERQRQSGRPECRRPRPGQGECRKAAGQLRAGCAPAGRGRVAHLTHRVSSRIQGAG